MYTQCPDCDIAFRVTAQILKQAAGKVRCGGCGSAFDALAHLSENTPELPAAPAANEPVPELSPDPCDIDTDLPRSISAEQSAALLKTLDELAGSDIRIEDTGVEWRVLDEEQATVPAADDDNADAIADIEAISYGIDESDDVIDVTELRFDDNTPLPDDFGLDNETPPRADRHREIDDELRRVESADFQADITLSEPGDWSDLLGEFQEFTEEVAASIDSSAQDLTTDAQIATDDSVAVVPDRDRLEEQHGKSKVAPHDQLNEPANDELAEELADEIEIDLQTSFIGEVQEGREPGRAIDPAESDQIGSGQSNTQSETVETTQDPDPEGLSIADELAALEDEQTQDDETGEYPKPEMTEQEHSVNSQIDEELMALALESENGSASTVIIAEQDADNDSQTHSDDTDVEIEVDDVEYLQSDDAPGVEAIIMEGDIVHSTLDDEPAADIDAVAAFQYAAPGEEDLSDDKHQHTQWYKKTISGVVALALLLAAQFVHQSRETLATMPTFNTTIGRIYAALGQPIQPAWDITGWRFEATRGSTVGDQQELTIYSRVGNKSDGPLPYPLIGISLTDRFEETIGSRMLEPAEYLATNIERSKLIESGTTFNAEISIGSTSQNATGFKLTVCYESSDEQLRCALDDFR